ncbi:MAG: FKBP-type peptidyl-prolyl cis-trans isomerase [Gammaproteobacteria bacterium]|nr:FKBP-type peptidyl-prolyl cis-trans isomerase [Gammaproteobacteria bacterium]
MKMKLVAVSVLGLMMTAPFAQAEAVSLKSDTEKLSYSIGVDLGKNIKQKQIEINVPALSKGISDGMNNAPLALTEEQMKETLVKFQKDMMAKSTAQFEQKAKSNQAAGQKFLAENKKKPGVVTTASGLQYKIVKNATGPKPTKTDTVTVEYTGRLLNGDVFDSTEKTGKPATFQLMQVIPGWTEALQLMPVGSTWELYVPSNLAYGVRNVGGTIGPNETLTFTVHLISIDAKKK